MNNKLLSKTLNLFSSFLVLMVASSQLQAHSGHEHQHDLVYMISHSLSHSGLFIFSVAVFIAAAVFALRKIRIKK